MDYKNEYNYSDESAEYSTDSASRAYARSDSGAKVRTVSRFRPGKAARTCMWIVGIIAGLTVIFTCVLVWIAGLRYLGVIDDPGAEPVKQPDIYNYYIYGDSSGQLPDGFDDFFGSGEEDNEGEEKEDPSGSQTPENGGEQPEGGQEGEQTPDSSGEKPAEPQSGNPGLGITIIALELEFTIDGKYNSGMVITAFADNSSFNGTEVQVNDMIVAANGIPTPTPDDLKAHFAGKSVGDELKLTIARYKDGVATTFDVTVKLVPIAG